MKISKQLIKHLIIFNLFFHSYTILNSNEPVDIWNIEKKEINNEKKNIDNIDSQEDLKTNSDTANQLISIEEEDQTSDEEKYLFGIYDPEENDFSLNMWELSSKEKIIQLTNKINKMKLSNDAKKIYSKLILTNAFMPNSFSKNEFLKLKINWLIKNEDLNLIDEFIINNNSQELDSKLLKYYLDEHLANGDLDNACNIFKIIKNLPNDIYTSKFQIYCLIYNNQKDLAQIQFDLLKENNFDDKFFEDKFNFLMGYTDKINLKVLDQSILDFHLSRIVNSQFVFEPDDNTQKNIWRYLKSFNLLQNLEEIDLENDEKIISIEIATHNKNYSEKDLLDLYARYRFSLQQLLNIEEEHKKLPQNQSRALLYQGILLSKNDSDKIKLLQILKESFKKNKIEHAFNIEFIKILEQINEREIPNKYKFFYNYYLTANISDAKKIKFNNKILHQSKIISYFSGEMEIKNSEKELKKILNKIKNNKKYFFSLKDKIVVESLISDGINIPKKDQDILELYTANIPTDIEVMINDGELAMIMLRLVEIIGEDSLDSLGTESLYFIISTLNKLNVDKIRNEIIIQVLPLKV